MFLDMDVAVSGSVVPAIETDFDRYWASESVWPLEAIIAADTVAEPIAATPRDDAATRAQMVQELQEYLTRNNYDMETGMGLTGKTLTSPTQCLMLRRAPRPASCLDGSTGLCNCASSSSTPTPHLSPCSRLLNGP